MNICMIAMSSDAPIRERQILLAPYVLKRYVENNTQKDAVNIKVVNFSYDADPTRMTQEVLKFCPDVVALSIYLWNYLELMQCAELLKKENQELLILAGGPMVSFNAEDVLSEHSYIDAISYDDTRGEIIFNDFIQCLIDGRSIRAAKGIVYRANDNKLVKTEKPEGKLNYSVELSPFINADIILDNKNNYYITIETSRGCPFDCGYCCWGSGRDKIEYYPMERVLKEVEIIYNNPNVKHVLFVDSSMTLNKNRTIKIVECMKNQKYYNDISTRMHLNIVSMNEELTQILSTIPGFSFDFGLQTANSTALKIISKRRPNANQFKEKLGKMKKWVPDIKFGIDLMIGLPGDSLDGFKKTLDFCFSLEPYRFFMAYPICLLPGTRFYEERDKLKFHYSDCHPLVITGTDDFPEQDIYEAVKIATWVQILTYYNPAISDFFYYICKGKSNGKRYEIMERWIDLIDSKVNLFKDLNLAKLGNNLVKEWYIAKGNLLEHASSAQVAYIIFSTIYELYKDDVSDIFNKKIALGLEIYSYYREQNINPIGMMSLNSLPKDFYKKYTEHEIRKVHSIFIR